MQWECRLQSILHVLYRDGPSPLLGLDELFNALLWLKFYDKLKLERQVADWETFLIRVEEGKVDKTIGSQLRREVDALMESLPRQEVKRMAKW